MKDGLLLRFAGGREREGKRSRYVDTADPVAMDQLMDNFQPTIPADRALLCMDCDSIFEATGTQRCPACGSTIAWTIGRSLNRVAR